MSILILFLKHLDLFYEIFNFSKGIVSLRDLIRCQSHVEDTVVSSVIGVCCLVNFIEILGDNIKDSIHNDFILKLRIIF
jgi:hypothetical protein